MDEDEALAELDEALALLEVRGEHAGHKFHGNQHSSGGGGGLTVANPRGGGGQYPGGKTPAQVGVLGMGDTYTSPGFGLDKGKTMVKGGGVTLGSYEPSGGGFSYTHIASGRKGNVRTENDAHEEILAHHNDDAMGLD